MGLVSQWVRVPLNNKNMDYFTNLGYTIPKFVNKYGHLTTPPGTDILVRVSDLKENSRVPLLMKCDQCGKFYEIKNIDYVNHHKNGLYFCSYSCSSDYRYENVVKHQICEKTPDRRTPGYESFMKQCLKRDHYRCYICGEDKALEVHHLNAYLKFPEQRLDVNNGVTLCRKCHSSFHKHYGKGDNTKEQFKEWINKIISFDKQDINIIERQVIRLSDGKVFANANKCAKEMNCTDGNIAQNCRHLTLTAMNDHFMWYGEYLSLSDKDLKNMLINIKLHPGHHKKSIYLLNTNEYFEGIVDFHNKYNFLNRDQIARICNSKGIWNVNNVVALWYEDYIDKNFNEESQNEYIKYCIKEKEIPSLFCCS